MLFKLVKSAGHLFAYIPLPYANSLNSHTMLQSSPILVTISSMASCMAIFIYYGTASMVHKFPMKLCTCMISCRRFWILYTHTTITKILSCMDSHIICLPPVYEYTADRNESCGQPVFTDGVRKLLISISFYICQLHHNTLLPIILQCF